MRIAIQQTSDLYADARQANRHRVPMLLIFSQHDCPFCERLKEEVINPMLVSGEYDNRIIIREIMIDDDQDIRDFDGNPVAPREVFTRYLLYVTPSVLLVDNMGNELAERQIGINTVDYYGYYLDQAIDQALRTLRS